MPKQRRSSRSRRKRGARPAAPPPGFAPAPRATPTPERPVAQAAPPAAPAIAEQRERAKVRASRSAVSVDFDYVLRDVRRIAVLATAVIVAIIVLSFFLP